MLCVFVTQYCLVFDTPINTKRIIKDTDTTISLRMIELIALILEYSRFTQYSKTMSKATWYKELAVVILCQFYSHMLTISR